MIETSPSIRVESDVSRPRCAEERDRITGVVLAPSRRRQRDEDLRAAGGAELDQRPTGRDPAEQPVLQFSPQECGERRLAGHGRSRTGHEQSDSRPVRVLRRVERRDDMHSRLGGSGDGESEQDERDAHPRDSRFCFGYGAVVLIDRSMHSQWLSNAYLLADEPGGTAVFIDSGAPLDPLHEVVEREGLHVTHLLTTHSQRITWPGTRAGRALRARDRQGPGGDGRSPHPGARDAWARRRPPRFLVNDTVAFTADILFKDAVGGGPDAAPIRRSVMES